MKRLQIVAVVITMILSGCGELEVAPYTISNGVVEIGSGSCYEEGGIRFDLKNTGEQAIKEISVYFRLYTEEGEGDYRAYPDYQSNQIEETISIQIDKGRSKEVCISIDAHMGNIPTKRVLAKPFVIRKIQYVNGSSWEDSYEVYRTEI